MAKKRYREEQIIPMLRRADVELGKGKKVSEICKLLEVTEQTDYRWRQKYGGMAPEMAKELAVQLGVDPAVAVKVGAPLIAVMLMVSVGLGLIARTVPQIHIFIVGMPLKIIIGLVFMVIVAPYLTAFLIELFSSYRTTLFDLIRMMAAVR